MIPYGSIGLGGVDIPLDTVNNKGVVWWVGSNRNTTGWSNPHISGRMTATWIAAGNGAPQDAIDRILTDTYTSNTTNSWWKLDISTNGSRRLAPTYMRYQNRNATTSVPSNGMIQGSNDDVNWTQVGGFATGEISTAASAWSTVTLTPAYGAFRYFKMTLTTTNSSGSWFLCMSEFELFGLLSE